jgi:hypothetical protein
MADFVQNSQTKTAVRELASPIADVTASNLIVQSVITDNLAGTIPRTLPVPECGGI